MAYEINVLFSLPENPAKINLKGIPHRLSAKTKKNDIKDLQSSLHSYIEQYFSKSHPD